MKKIIALVVVFLLAFAVDAMAGYGSSGSRSSSSTSSRSSSSFNSGASSAARRSQSSAASTPKSTPAPSPSKSSSSSSSGGGWFSSKPAPAPAPAPVTTVVREEHHYHSGSDHSWLWFWAGTQAGGNNGGGAAVAGTSYPAPSGGGGGFGWFCLTVSILVFVVGVGYLVVGLYLKRRERTPERPDDEEDEDEPRCADPAGFLRETAKDGVFYVSIDTPFVTGDNWALHYARDVIQHHKSGNYSVTDYVFTRGSSPDRVILRYVPKEDGDDVQTHDIVVLKLHDEIGADHPDYDGLNRALDERDTDGTGKFVIQNDDNVITDEFWRPKRVYCPHFSTVREFDARGNLRGSHEIDLWDFSRVDSKVAGGAVTEHLFVERDLRSDYVEIYRGREVSPERISF